MTPRRRCTGAILAGGRATRFGGKAKGLERVGGERIIDRVARALREACDDIVLVANEPRAATWLPGVRVIADVRKGVGALGGVHAALSGAPDAVAVLSWDAPFVPGPLMRALRDAGEADDADAAMPSSDSRWGFEPLCAWYGPRCREAIERHVDTGDQRAGAWQGALRTVRVDAAPWGDPRVLFFNVNTPEDLIRAQLLLTVPEAT
jgi:molybdopterin-guanine dinucleotide biosynthesis protein A